MPRRPRLHGESETMIYAWRIFVVVTAPVWMLTMTAWDLGRDALRYVREGLPEDHLGDQ
jgi:uncharacterized membrane protein YccC